MKGNNNKNEIKNDENEVHYIDLAYEIPYQSNEISLNIKKIPSVKLLKNIQNNINNNHENNQLLDEFMNQNWIIKRGTIDEELLHNIQEKCLRKIPRNDNNNENNNNNLLSPFDPNTQFNNTQLKRPAHDRWGIQKLIFIFCDDFLKRIYEFPYYHNEEYGWKSLFLPIFKQLNISTNKIVRILLALMPPGSVIPVHNDTGYWVKHTHRMHVPIITNENVNFSVGYDNDHMKRCILNPGDIIELNNQSKHFVENNSNDIRIHLIFDYLDDSYNIDIPRIQTTESTILNQTRRSIDISTEVGTNPIPSWIILGAQKSGTTSIYEYLNQHPLISRSKCRETHFFDWRWNNELNTIEEKYNYYKKFFYSDLLYKYPSIKTGESTPSYLLFSNLVIERIKEVCPHNIKFIIMLRNPIYRAYSHYQMSTDPNGSPAKLRIRGKKWRDKTFEEVIDMELKELEEFGLIDNPRDNNLFQQYISTRPLNTGSHSLLARGFYALQLIPWFKEFDRNQFLILRTEDLKLENGKQNIMNQVFDHIDIPSIDYNKEDEKFNTRDYNEMNHETKEKLKLFYNIYNEHLYELLDRDMEW